MYFHKETIMGQVLHQVNTDEKNQFYIEQIEDLIEDINEKVYMDEEEIKVWNKNGLLITDRDLGDGNLFESSWIFFETPHTFEYSWLVQELEKIYQPTEQNSYRLFTTLGFLLKIYDEKYDDLSDVLRMVAIVSIVFLHPDHIGYDKFIVHPIKLPNFGSEF